MFTHEVLITFKDGTTKIIHTNCPEAWESVSKIMQGPCAKREPVAVTIRARLVSELENYS